LTRDPCRETALSDCHRTSLTLNPVGHVPCSVEEEGITIAAEFRQQAIHHAEAGELVLVNCEKGKRTPLGSFAERVRDPRALREFRVDVGGPQPRARLQPTEELEIRLKLAGRFDAFSIIPTESFVRSQSGDGLVIGIFTHKPVEVIDVAKDLCRLLGLESVGVSFGGIHQRVREWTDPEFLLRVWKLKEC
jgi:hypothetical protein